MGILNCTPDSFSDGGDFSSLDKALKHARRLIEDGADIIDIGGESTRPHAKPVGLEEELERVIPAIKAIRQKDPNICISIDTYKSEVARQALESGADLVNDVSAMQMDQRMAKVVSQCQCPVVLMHMRGTPTTMRDLPNDTDVISEVMELLNERIDYAKSCGILDENIWIDPGLGFGKSPLQNAQILKNLDELIILDKPILIGPSRKLFLDTQKAREKKFRTRIEETIAASIIGAMNGAQVIRVHDVAGTKSALAVADVLR